jgi:hypothetical protein
VTAIQEALAELAKQNGGVLTARAVVDAARSDDSPLHDSFTWDDNEAAEAWRLHQARNLILRVHVVMENRDGKSITVRAWHSLTPDRAEEEGGYREVVRIMRNADLRAQLLIDAKAEMDRFCAKYATLDELAEVFAAMRRVK